MTPNTIALERKLESCLPVNSSKIVNNSPATDKNINILAISLRKLNIAI